MDIHLLTNFSHLFLFSFFCFTFIMDNLKILQWNARNFHTNFDQFTQFLDKNNCDVICLQSVNRTASDLPVLDGYYYPPYYRLNDKKNVTIATYVRSNLAVKGKLFQSTTKYSVSIELTLNNKPFTIVNCYYPEGVSNKNETEWISNLTDYNEQILILGDFNAHHDYWTNRSVESRRGGNYLSQHIIDSSLTLLNDGSFTRLPERSTDSCTAIDLSIISACMAPQCQWMIQDDSLGSDHLPIIISMETNNVRKLEQDLESGFNTKQADWTLFKTVLCEKMRNHTILNTDSVQKQYDQFRKLVLEAAEISIPRKSNDFQVRYGNAWWNDACSIAVTNKRKAYHYYKRKENDENLEIFKKAKYECKRVINQAKIKYLENYLENNVITYKDATKLWRKIQKIKNRYHLPEQPLVHPPFYHNGQY